MTARPSKKQPPSDRDLMLGYEPRSPSNRPPLTKQLSRKICSWFASRVLRAMHGEETVHDRERFVSAIISIAFDRVSLKLAPDEALQVREQLMDLVAELEERAGEPSELLEAHWRNRSRRNSREEAKRQAELARREKRAVDDAINTELSKPKGSGSDSS